MKTLTFKAVLFDDHLLFTQSVRDVLLKCYPQSNIIYFSKQIDVTKELDNNDTLFLFIDLIMPNVDVKEFIIATKKKHPNLLIIVLTSITDVMSIKGYLSLGINGYISKAISLDELETCIQKIYNGEVFISSDLTGKLASLFYADTNTSLTDKELEILRMVATGYTVEKTATLLFMSRHTVMSHRRKIMSKLDLHSAAELVKYAFENKLI